MRVLLLCLLLAPLHGADAAVSQPRARPLDDRVYEPTRERLERGRYLAEHVLQCFICHSERDASQPGAPPVEARKGAGVVFSESEGRLIVAPNITPDFETGAGGWTDDMLARAIREGIGHDGRALHPSMWYGSFAMLSDEDLAAVVVYLRSIPAVRNSLPLTRLPDEERTRIAGQPQPITEPVPGPAPGDALARGKYLVNVADCGGCHTSWYSKRMPGLFAGGNHIERRYGSAFSTNITHHASGVGYPADAFIAVMRGGKGGSLSALMPWVAFKGMTDADLEAIHLALGTLQPVAHYIGNVGPPEHCAVCGQEHPLGAYNKHEAPPRVAVDAASLKRLAGRYRHPGWDLTITIRADGARLYGREADGPEIELVPQSPLRFLAPGWPAPVEFIVDEAGRATHLVALELERERFERLP
jgi:mono/diheme cytochrome c family protein